MNSLNWPKIFKGNSTSVIENNEATLTCMHLLLGSEVGELFGDPEFGLRLKKYTFNQNNYVLKDILIDEIYTSINTFCPQVYLERKDVKVSQDGTKFYATIKCTNKLDFQTNTYSLVLFENDEEQ